MILFRCVAVALSPLLATLGCATHRAVAQESRPPAARTALVNEPRNVLFSEELRTARGADAFEIIQQLRPQFLRTRGHTPTVFVDNLKRGGLTELRRVPASDIAEIRYIDGASATQLFGYEYGGGVIHILTRRAQPVKPANTLLGE